MLITIAVIAYNSESTIIETLNSIENLDYDKKKLQVIISDDFSNDSTVSIAESWRESKLSQFSSIEILKRTRNHGVSHNCNTAWRAAKGEWIKTIAADDLLLTNCIKDNVEYVEKNKDSVCIFSNMKAFTSKNESINIEHDYRKILSSSKVQYEYLLDECFLHAPTSFIKKSLLESINYCEEKYEMIEDYPLWIKMSSCGHKFSYLDKFTVLYRKTESLSRQSRRVGNLQYFESLFLVQKELIWPNLGLKMFLRKWDDIVNLYEKKIWLFVFGNKPSKYYLYYRIASTVFRPYRIYKLLKLSSKS